MNDDSALLQRYAQDGSEAAFAELVSRHLGLVYHAALRQVGGDARRAEEVAQAVFIDLARKAAALARRPLLAGWLHTSTRFAAANLQRAERRRQFHEQEAFAMNEMLHAPASDAAWERLRPVIDDALHALAERDREAVLLRFFEGQSFAAVGARLAVTEDGARVRVDRALEKIRKTLIRRGVTSTSAALATVLASHAGEAAPARLAAKISAASLATGLGTGVGTGAVGLGLFTLMSTKVVVGLTVSLALLATGITLYQGREVQTARARLTAARTEQAALQATVNELERQLISARARARAAEDDSAKLLGALEEAAKTQTPAPSPSPVSEPITRESVEARYKQAQELAKTGRAEEALREFLWCYDEGMPPIALFGGVLHSDLLDHIARLGKTYPPALDALRERRHQSELTMQTGPGPNDLEAALRFGSINRALGETDRTLQFWDQLTPKNRRRFNLGHQVYEALVKAHRYQDAVQAMSYRAMNTMFDAFSNSFPSAKPVQTPDEAKYLKEKRIRVVNGTVACVEALAGTGDLEHAEELAGRLLKFDGSPETQAALRQGLARAGQAKPLVEDAPR